MGKDESILAGGSGVGREPPPPLPRGRPAGPGARAEGPESGILALKRSFLGQTGTFFLPILPYGVSLLSEEQRENFGSPNSTSERST